MATTETERAPGSQDEVTKRPGASGSERRPLSGIEGPLSDVQHKGSQPSATDDEHEGATEQQVSDRVGPGVGFDQEPEREKDEGGVA